MLDGNLKQPPTPDKRGEVKITDEDIVKKVEDRSTKVKTMDPAKPENTPYASAALALAAFKDSREKLIDYTKSTDADLRNHIVMGLPFGAIDGYQFILFISAHSNRHMQQIIEVKPIRIFQRVNSINMYKNASLRAAFFIREAGY